MSDWNQKKAACDRDVGAPGRHESWQDMYKREAAQREADGPIDRISGDDAVDGALASVYLLAAMVSLSISMVILVWIALSILGVS